MHNPFAEFVDESTDCELIEQSKNGCQSAIEKLILRHQAWIDNIAIRMVFHPHDAEEVTQEVLIKASVLGQSSFDSRRGSNQGALGLWSPYNARGTRR